MTEDVINDTVMADFCGRPDIKNLSEKEQAIEWTKYKMSLMNYFFDPEYARPIVIQDEEVKWDKLLHAFQGYGYK